ncbi:uncharacterized protein LOC117648574 isoform X2 [Thrips palmi]|nr:uncharacterized protein LOC117648574 isoform X2 [Thrips palmi]
MEARLWSRVCVSFEEAPDKPWEPETRPLGGEGGALWLRIETMRGVGALRRVLLRAPCLRRLQLSFQQPPPEDLRDDLSAACRLPIQELAMLRVPKELALPLIRAQADTLRVLEWRQPKQDLRFADTKDYRPADGDMPYMPENIWATLARLSLSELVVDWAWSTSALGLWWITEEMAFFRQQGGQGGGADEAVTGITTRLTKFSLHVTDWRDERSQKWQRVAAWPLLRANAANLRELHLCLDPVPSLEGLGLTSLRAVTVPLKMDLRPLLGCRALRSVTLLGEEVYHTVDATGHGLNRKSVSFLDACAHPESGLPLEALCLEGFSKYSTPQLPGAAAKLASLRELRFIKCHFRACDGSFYGLQRALGKLRELRRLEVGYATDIRPGTLKRLGAALPPTLRWLRLDIYKECERQDAEIREVVAAHPGLHVVRTRAVVDTPPPMADDRSMCPDRCETLHGGRCGAKIVANHSNVVDGQPQGQGTDRGGRSSRLIGGRGGRGQSVDCDECASVLRYQHTSLTEVDNAPSAGSHPQDNPDGQDDI